MTKKNDTQWTSLSEISKEDIVLWDKADQVFSQSTANRVIEHFQSLATVETIERELPVSRYAHSLQCATRASKDGRDDEYVVCALLHDIGDLLCVLNHQDIAAAILKPYVSERNHWMVEKHAVFQGYYYFHHLGGDRNIRDRYKGHPFFEYTAEFCEMYDQRSFDPGYDTLPFEHFEEIVRKVLSRPRGQPL